MQDIPPPARLLQLTTGYQVSRTLYAITKHHVVDAIKEGHSSAPQIASHCGLNADAVYRSLRLLSALGIFKELPEQHFELTPTSELLLQNHPASLRSSVMFLASPLLWSSWSNFDEALVRGGGEHGLAAETMGVTNFFELFDKEVETSEHFNQHMTNMSRITVPPFLQAYTHFGEVRSVVDIGGSQGTFVLNILRQFPNITEGINYDLPQVIEMNKKMERNLEPAVADRFKEAGGSFLDEKSGIPEGKDLYTLKMVIHDWSDTKAVQILNSVRKAMHAGSKLVAFENIITPGPESTPAKLLDLHMMQICGGKERSHEQWNTLAAAAGLKVTRIITARAPSSAVEMTIV